MSPRLPAAYYETVFVLPDPPAKLPAAFGIVTAFNPMDQPQPAAANEEQNDLLKQLIQCIDPQAFEVLGCAPDFAHCEPGWGIRGSLATCLELARRFRQRALWWVSNDCLQLVSCAHPEPEEVDHFSRRVVPAPSQP